MVWITEAYPGMLVEMVLSNELNHSSLAGSGSSYFLTRSSIRLTVFSNILRTIIIHSRSTGYRASTQSTCPTSNSLAGSWDLLYSIATFWMPISYQASTN